MLLCFYTKLTVLVAYAKPNFATYAARSGRIATVHNPTMTTLRGFAMMRMRWLIGWGLAIYQNIAVALSSELNEQSSVMPNT